MLPPHVRIYTLYPVISFHMPFDNNQTTHKTKQHPSSPAFELATIATELQQQLKIIIKKNRPKLTVQQTVFHSKLTSKETLPTTTTTTAKTNKQSEKYNIKASKQSP